MPSKIIAEFIRTRCQKYGYGKQEERNLCLLSYAGMFRNNASKQTHGKKHLHGKKELQTQTEKAHDARESVFGFWPVSEKRI